VGEEYHLSRQRAHGVILVEGNADAWKTYLHDRFATPLDQVGAMTLFGTEDSNDHLTFARQLTAEKQELEIVPGKGEVRTWVRIGRRANHYLDVYYMCMIAGHMAGVRLNRANVNKAKPRKIPKSRPGITTPDGRAFLVTQR
jgi:hypothetical protein